MKFDYCQLGPRLAAHWRLKLVGIPASLIAFSAAYFALLKFPVFPVTQMPTTALDRLIDFNPGSLLPYASLWIYVELVPGLLDKRSELIAYALAAVGVCIAGMAVFFFWPTSIPQPSVDWSRYPSFSLLRAIDRSGNACPSLHAAFAVFSALWLNRLLRQMGDLGPLRFLNWAWCAAILYSTLATKQHVAVDLFAGAALGLAGAGAGRLRGGRG